MTDTFARLEETIRARRSADPESSYVAKLTAKGRPKMAQKLGEEAVETVIAALSGDAKATTSEAADLLFHLCLLLADMGLSLNDVAAELERREGLSGLAEKAARKPD
ncbi:MAG TPA: phosphoribosyl-ATP diphosphatase [Sphingobium sp.]|nr:phosphoribosyl-ATP diphosphatase [Sphingobium sp.]